jgi:hypothetical protein
MLASEGEENEQALSVLLLNPFDPEKVCVIAESLARKRQCRFDGLQLSKLPSNPQSLANTLTFTLERILQRGP